MAPARAHNSVPGRAPAVVVPCHLQAVLSDRAWHDNVVDLPSGVVIQHVVSTARRDQAFEGPRYADRIVIVANEHPRADCCKEQNEKNLFHVVRRISGQLAACLSGLIPEFLAWHLPDFALQTVST